jgi:lipopolysaccharide/colanic/teichoic acid biosynthesis glycosyltransferase
MSLIVARQSVWRSTPIQLIGMVTVTTVPLIVRFILPGVIGSGNAYNLLITTLASLFAVLMVFFIDRGIIRYPGVEIGSSVIAFVSLAYGLVLAFFVLGRIEYNRFTLLASYFLSITWFLWSNYRGQRRSDLLIGVVPPYDGINIHNLPGVVLRTLPSPDAPVNDLDAVTLDLRLDLDDLWDRRIADLALAGVPVYHIKHLQESLTGRVELEHLSETSYGTLSPPIAYMAFRRIADRIVAFLMLILLVPLFPIIWATIKMDGPGPVIFRQRRIGYRGKPFTVFKFRTMKHRSAEEQSSMRTEAMTKSNDSRITRTGYFLRKTRIDELPQIVNILRGEMSWIGPRPEAEVLSTWYEKEIPFYRYRHIVYPGITGWAQVNQGHVSEVVDVKDKLYYDFYYIKHLSPWIDLLIVGRTIRTMITGVGAK